MAAGYDSDEDAGQGRFGAEFADAEFLSNAAVAVLLDSIRKGEEHREVDSSLTKSLEYAKAFPGAVGSMLHSAEAVDAVRRQLASLTFSDEDGAEKKLTPYEIVALANLNPDKAREAVVHIPSLERFSAEDLDTVVTTLHAASAGV
uniref:RNA polymerase Rpb4/RPC9 core domain-containing protein n=1 Tax=Bicosoecida sp. CB-2014 TaxID=1486930 RepID=A0A7S1CG20_9STRA|mmetsp:Transcript_25555/g.89080  ORF Transcript_25555/g.89080 Transcript_25555/m.89080 type:complete len:146 (+) Transcript_25555:207-644(+)